MGVMVCYASLKCTEIEVRIIIINCYIIIIIHFGVYNISIAIFEACFGTTYIPRKS